MQGPANPMQRTSPFSDFCLQVELVNPTPSPHCFRLLWAQGNKLGSLSRQLTHPTVLWGFERYAFMLLMRVCCPHVTQACLLSSFCAGRGSQVSETEREDLEESEKIQYWVERLCQTRLEQISSADNEISEVTASFFPHRPSCCFRVICPGDRGRQAGHCRGPPLPAHSRFLSGGGEHTCLLGLSPERPLSPSSSEMIPVRPVVLAK